MEDKKSGNLAELLGSLHCVKCGADSYKLVIDKNFKNRIFFLRCLRCGTLFALYDEVLTEDETKFLKDSGYVLEPFTKLDMEHKKELTYVE